MVTAKLGTTEFHVGDTIRVSSNVVEGTKQRIQVFEGMVISICGRGENRNITVRRIGTGGIGVERKWPLNATSLVKIEIKKKANKVRRSKLYFLRNATRQEVARI